MGPDVRASILVNAVVFRNYGTWTCSRLIGEVAETSQLRGDELAGRIRVKISWPNLPSSQVDALWALDFHERYREIEALVIDL
jgi:hypothetical protein